MALEMHDSHYVPAGVWLRDEIVEPAGITLTLLARHLHVSRQAISTLLNGHSGMSAAMALRFEKAFGVKADVLLRMQLAYELMQARTHEHEIDIERLVPA